MGLTNEERARALRRAGLSRSQIADALGLRSGGSALSRWLKDVPPPEWTKRPNAKDDLREKAVAMRRTGMSYREIGEEVGVAKSTLSYWLRDVPLTDDQQARLAQLRAAESTKAGETLRRNRILRETATISEATTQVTTLAESELFVAGVVAYWAEGKKAKPWDPSRRVQFINSDPEMIKLFMKWLAMLGFGTEACSFRVSIHERGDVAAATAYWASVVEVPESSFKRPTIKRHNPKTVRHNTGIGYHGCLMVDVLRSTDLHRRIEGWWRGIVRAPIGEASEG